MLSIRNTGLKRERTDSNNLPLQEKLMVSIELQILTLFRALAEIAGLFLLAQGTLFLLAGSARDRNFVYQLFVVITRPVISLTRCMMPKVIVLADLLMNSSLSGGISLAC